MYRTLLIVPVLALTAAACDVDVEDKGRIKAPEVEVTEGNLDMPKVRVEGGDIDAPEVRVTEKGDIDLPEYTIRGPEVEVKETWVKVPTVDVDIPEEDDDATADAND